MKFKTTLFTLILLLLLSVGAHSQNNYNKAVLCVPDVPPWYGKNLPHSGPLTKATVKALTHAGYEVRLQHASWARIMFDAQQGKCMILGLWETKERRAHFYYSAMPLVRQTLGVYTRRNVNIDALKGGVLAVERSTYVPDSLVAQGWKIYELTSLTKGLEMLRLARIDALYSETGHMDYLIAKDSKFKDEIVKAVPQIEVKFGHLAASKNYQGAQRVLAAFDQHIEAVFAQMVGEEANWPIPEL